MTEEIFTRHNTAEEIISELEDGSTETFLNQNTKEKKGGYKKTESLRTVIQYSKE